MWSGAWPSLEIQNLEKGLVEVEQLVTVPQAGQADEVTRAIARFLTVRSCGYLEQSVEECIRSYIKSKASPHVANHGQSYFGRGANPAPDKLESLVKRFDGKWADDLRDLFDDNDQELRREISLLVSRRNQIAHGLGEGMGSRKALDLAKSARLVADWFIDRFDPR